MIGKALKNLYLAQIIFVKIHTLEWTNPSKVSCFALLGYFNAIFESITGSKTLTLTYLLVIYFLL